MDMGSEGPVAPWFTTLPLSDPRCDNASCVAFAKGMAASQARTSFTYQFFYGHFLLYIYAGVAFIAASLYGLHIYQGTKARPDANRGPPSAWDKAAAMMRSVSYRRVRGRAAEYVAMPSLGVAILLLVFWLAATIMSFLKHPYYREERGFGSPPIGVRTGLMAFALMPITVATAGKVNLVSYITGLGHEKLNVFHRWTAYLMVYLSVIHTIPYIVQPLQEGGAAALRKQFYAPGGMEYTGTPALGILAGLALLSLPPLRRLAYEAFVHVHILMAITYLGLCFWHAAKSGDSWLYLWATVAIWLLQLSIRMFGKISVFQLGERWFTQSPVTMTRLPMGMIKMELEVQGRWRFEPGQHAFLRFVRLRPLDNHPFTIASVPEEHENEDPMRRTTRMVFYVRPHGGVTARIASLAKAEKTVRAVVDGPYGTLIRPRVEMRYDTAVLIAGGGGISGVLPWLQHLSRRVSDETTAIKSVTLVWIVRRSACLSWVSEELEACRAAAPTGSIHLEIWVTGDEDSVSEEEQGSDSGDQAEITENKETAALGVTVDSIAVTGHGRRPSVAAMLPGLVGAGRTLVLGCGPESLKIDLSNAVARLQGRVLRGEAREVRLHTETFGW